MDEVKHNSALEENFLEGEKDIEWKSHSESPDKNPIENVWQNLEDYFSPVF